MTAEVISERVAKSLSLLENSQTTKGTTFTPEERERLGLLGLLPHAVETLDRQAERVLGHLDQKPSDLKRYIYLTALLDRNETLFYRVVMGDPARFLPIVYNPTVSGRPRQRRTTRRSSLPTSIVSTSPQPLLASSLTTHSMTTLPRP